MVDIDVGHPWVDWGYFDNQQPNKVEGYIECATTTIKFDLEGDLPGAYRRRIVQFENSKFDKHWKGSRIKYTAEIDVYESVTAEEGLSTRELYYTGRILTTATKQDRYGNITLELRLNPTHEDQPRRGMKVTIKIPKEKIKN